MKIDVTPEEARILLENRASAKAMLDSEVGKGFISLAKCFSISSKTKQDIYWSSDDGVTLNIGVAEEGKAGR